MIRWPITLFLIISFFQAFGQAYHTQWIGVKDGLAQTFVHCQLKTTDGVLWIGTQDGLSRFDGHQFENFYHDPFDSTTLTGNYIWTLFEDRDQNLWIGTNGTGLCKYNPRIRRFERFQLGNPSSNHSVRAITQDLQGNIWLATENGLYQLKTGASQAILIENSPLNQPFLAFHWVNAHKLLIGSIQQIFHLDIRSGQLEKCRMPVFKAVGFHDFEIGEKETIWAATGNGLVHFTWNEVQDSIQFINHFLQGPLNNLPSNYVTSLCKDHEGAIWVATNQGIARIQAGNNQIQKIDRLPKGKSDSKSLLPSELVYSLVELEPGWMSVGTQEGIAQFSFLAPDFKFISLEGNPGISAHGLVQIKEDQILGATENGFFIWDGDSSISSYTPELLPEMQDAFMVNLTKGKGDNYAYAALRRGGYAKIVFEEEGIDWQAFQLDYGPNPNYGTNYILEEDDRLWIATSGIGLWSKGKDGRFTIYGNSNTEGLEGNYIFHLYLDRDQRLWIATADGGLSVLHLSDNSFQSFRNDPKMPESLSSDIVLSTYQDGLGRIWVSTANGLNLWLGEGRFKRFYKRDGLPNDVVYGMLEDQKGRLWLSTNQGISKVEFEGEAIQFENYGPSDGLFQLEFNQHSFHKLSDHQLLFGGLGGLSLFHPDAVGLSDEVPVLQFTKLLLYNEEVSIGKKTGILQKSIDHQSKIRLNYDQNFVAFEFVGIQFRHASEVKYRYQLEGIDEDWVEAGIRNFANYPDLKPGEYRFKFTASNHNGIWNPNPRIVNIVINPPPWQTIWAYLFYLLILMGSIYAYIQFKVRQVRRIEAIKANERSQFRKRSARDFHDEAGNRITKIALMTELVKRQSEAQPALTNLLEQLEKNIQELRQGMRDFIWVLDPDQDNLLETLLRLKGAGHEMFELSPIQFQFSSIEEDWRDISVSGAQRRHLMLLFKEAINNCIKYSNAQKAVLEVRQQDKSWCFQFSDDGNGFDLTNIQRGNGLKNMKARAKKLHGELSIESSPGKGTKLTLLISALG